MSRGNEGTHRGGKERGGENRGKVKSTSVGRYGGREGEEEVRGEGKKLVTG